MLSGEINSNAAYLQWSADEPRLHERVLAAAAAMEPGHLQDLFVNHARFDWPGAVEEPDGTTRPTSYYTLEMLLEVMPDYMQNARQAGLLPRQAYGLVRTLLVAEKRNEFALNDTPVVQLSRAFACRVERQEPLTDEDYIILHALVADTANNEGDNVAVLDAYRALTRLGFSSAESDKLIRGSLYADSLVIDWAIQVFNALSIAPVSFERLHNICSLISGERPQLPELQASYMALKELIVAVCPRYGMLPDDLLEMVGNRLAAGCTMQEVAQSFATDAARVVAQSDNPDYPAERRPNMHFMSKPGPLELSPLPYRTERSFSEGAADIGRIALHRIRHREAIGEGLWVFDAGATSPTWYSVGGETGMDTGKRIACLSGSPIFYHAHPVAREGLTGPGRSGGVYPDAAVDIVASFLAATPSGRDYSMIAELLSSPEYRGGVARSFIAHGSGTTEYTFPYDPEAIEAMSKTSLVRRDELLADINWERIMFARRWGGLLKGKRRSRPEVVGVLVDRLNRTLPRDFQLRLIAPGVRVDL